MKRISIFILITIVFLASCKKTPEVNLKYVDVERDLVTVGTTTANIQCDYDYIATLKKAYLYYGEGENEDDFTSAEMRVVQNTLYVELTGLRENTFYYYFYEFHNGFNSMRTAMKSFKTETAPGDVTLPTVITAVVTEITTNSAKGGGEVTDDGGAEVTDRGICWSTNANPTLDDSHVAAGSGTGAFAAAMNGLEANTTYHVRAYAINEKGTAYGLDRDFITGGGSGAPEGAIDGLFSVSPTQKVYFSQGNLQYQASTNTWRFAERQWDYVGGTTNLGEQYGIVMENGVLCDNSLISADYTGWIDLFGWGTSGWNNGNIYFHPWDSEATEEYFMGQGYGPTDGTNYEFDLTNTYANADWGIYNVISNGGNVSGFWRTLTNEEWMYVSNSRNTPSGIRYAMARVNEVNGVILLPDDWNASTYALNNTNGSGDYSGNIISDTQWSILEAGGAVFLPAAGCREEHKLLGTQYTGHYWSVSCVNGGLASTTYFYDGTVICPDCNDARSWGASVRLVHDATFQPIQIPTVTTSDVSNITSNSAICGGEVTNDGGATVTERGICWSQNANPTLSDSHVVAGSGMGVFTAAMSGLEINTTYHVRAYATNVTGTAYGQEVEFTTPQGGGSGEHEYVDLGLPSGILWATCNVGANAPEEYGDYFAWGEITPKTTYSWSNYQYCNGDHNQLTKYCNDASYGYNGFTDDLTSLFPEDDAATANWGNGWRMPTEAEWDEIFSNTTHTWTTQNSVKGYLFTASNGNSLFLPAAGYRWGGELGAADRHGHYWSSSLNSYSPCYARLFFFGYASNYMDSYYRSLGHSVRPVRSAP